MSVSMTLNNYDFPSGVPVLRIQETHNRTGAGKLFSRTARGTLTGHLLAFNGDCPASFSKVVTLEEELREQIVSCSGCPIFEVYCEEELVISTHARVLNVSIDTSSDNWVLTAPYTIELEWDIPPSGEPDCDSCLRQISENWSIEQLDPRQYHVTFESGCDNQSAEYYKITHSLSAQANNCCINDTEESGWLIAKDWVIAHASGGVDEYALIEFSGLNEKLTQSMEFYEHIRSYNYSPLDGSFGLEESWVAIAGFSGGYFQEEFEITEKFERQNRFREFVVSGSIKGLEQRNSAYNVTATRIENAEARWSQIDASGLSERLGCYFDLICPVNPFPVSYTISKNPPQGTINFSYTFDERPTVMFSGAQYETVNITDTRAAYTISSNPILGRKAGPLLVNSNMGNLRQKSVSFSAIYPNPSGCVYPTGICEKMDFMEDDILAGEDVLNNFLCCMETRLHDQYDLVYKINDSVQYDPIGGSYQRDVAWNYQKCAIPILEACSGTGFEE